MLLAQSCRFACSDTDFPLHVIPNVEVPYDADGSPYAYHASSVLKQSQQVDAESFLLGDASSVHTAVVSSVAGRVDEMNWPTEVHDEDRPSLCASTIQYLAAHGFIDPTYDPGLAARTALQDLHADDELDELTGNDDDDDDDELAAQLIEPKGPNPQQQMFSEKPTGPTTLLEGSKALIAQTTLPAPSVLDEEPSKPLLRFDGRDALVMTRAALKDTPVLSRKSTFKPLVAKSHHAEAQKALKHLKVSPSPASEENPPVDIKSIDACLKLGPAASKELFGKSQAVLATIQAIIKPQTVKTQFEGLIGENDPQISRRPSPILMPRRLSGTPTIRDFEEMEKLDYQSIFQNYLTDPKTPSSHSMSQLMEDVDRWGGNVPILSPFPINSASTRSTSPLVSSESFSPGGRLCQSIQLESPLMPRASFSSNSKRNRSANQEGPAKPMKKHKSSPSKPMENHDSSNLAAKMEQEVKKTEAHLQPTTHPAEVSTAEWASLPARHVTFHSIAEMYEDHASDDEELDELGSSIEDIEDFVDSTSLPVLGAREGETPILDLLQAIDEFETKSKQTTYTGKVAQEQATLEPRMSSTTSEELIFTPPNEGAGYPECPSRKPSLDIRVDVTPPAIDTDRQGGRVDQTTEEPLKDFFMEERTQLKHPDSDIRSSETQSRTPVVAPDKPRQPLTQLSMEGLAALVASKRRKKQNNSKITDFFGHQHAREPPEPPKRNSANVNGYLVLRSRNDLIKSPSAVAAKVQTKPEDKSKPSAVTAAQQTVVGTSAVKSTAPPASPLELKQTRASVSVPLTTAPLVHPGPTYDLTALNPVRCFGSFRLLQNTAVDRALDMHSVEIIYPEEADPISLRALNISKTSGQPIFAQIVQPDIILSPRSCLFYYRLSYIYQMTKVLGTNYEQKRMHHSKILLDALKLLSEQYDKITLVMEMFEPSRDDKPSKQNSTTVIAFTPAIKRALDKLHDAIGALAEQIQRPIGEELNIELLYATTPLQAAAFARERLEMRFAEDVQLGQLGWDQKLYDMFVLNDLSAHHLVIEAGSLEAFQEMPEEERIERFSAILGSERLKKINRILRSQAAFGSLAQDTSIAREGIINDRQVRIPPTGVHSQDVQQTTSCSDNFFEDPNYTAYNHLLDSFSQVDRTQPKEDTFVNALHLCNSDSYDRVNVLQDEGIRGSSSQGWFQDSSPQFEYEMDDLNDLILDDADVEAELNEPIQNINRPFTPIQHMGSFWSEAGRAEQYEEEPYNTVEPLYGGFGMQEDEDDAPVHEFDLLETFNEFDPDNYMSYE